MKREIYRLRWDEGEWGLHFPKGGSLSFSRLDKRSAEKRARMFCRIRWEKQDQPTQLLIYNKNGRIGRGGRSEASYGCDSRRRKG